MSWHERVGSGLAFLKRTLRYFAAGAQSETSGARRRDISGMHPALECVRRRGVSAMAGSMLGDGLVRGVEERFGKGKFEHDLALSIGHFENCIQKPLIGAFGLQQFADQRSRGFPSPVGIAQVLTFGVGDQLIADTGVEKITRHGPKSTSGWGSNREPAASGQFFIWGSCARPAHIWLDMRNYERIDPMLVWTLHAQLSEFLLRRNIEKSALVEEDFTGEVLDPH